MNKFWRIHHEINKAIGNNNFANYLEIGAEIGLNIRQVKAKRKFAVSESLINRDRVLYQWQMKSEDFFSFIKPEDQGKYRAVFLRDWNDANLEERIRKCHALLLPDGVLFIEGIDVKGRTGNAWKFAVGLKKAGFPVMYFNNRYMAVYKPDGEIEGTIKSKMRLENYLKIKDDFNYEQELEK